MQSAFAKKIAEAPPKPPLIIVLKPEHFAQDYPERPTSDIAAGVRILSEHELQEIAGEAGKEARLFHPDAETSGDGPFSLAYDDAIVRLAVGRCLTNPNDSRDPYFAAADEMVGLAFPPKTIRFVWDSLEKVTLSNSPVALPATNEEIADVIELITEGYVEKLSPSSELRMRKLMSFMREELLDAKKTLTGDDEEEVEDLEVEVAP